MIHQHGFTQQGWECPKCGKVYSPTTIMCFYCPQTVKTNITTNTPWNTVTVTNDIINGTTTDTTTICFDFVNDTINTSSTKCMKCGLEKWQHPIITNL
jgi:ribosomal protein S27AE